MVKLDLPTHPYSAAGAEKVWRAAACSMPFWMGRTVGAVGVAGGFGWTHSRGLSQLPSGWSGNRLLRRQPFGLDDCEPQGLVDDAKKRD
jgi:hypothetical protein